MFYKYTLDSEDWRILKFDKNASTKKLAGKCN